ncbi:MAG: transglutaminase domain-containing protein [Deltaproteobacteria bacterium]|nr:transglutaminase domain-containing protein [Deltaproteobacteria bacterium]
MRLSLFLGLILFSVISVSQNFGVEAASRERWMGIYSGDDKIGYSRTKISTHNGDKEVLEQMKLKMTVLGNDQDVDTDSKFLLDGFNLKGFESVMRFGLVDLKVTGERIGDKLKIQMQSISGNTELTIPVDREPLVNPLLYDWLMSQNPEIEEGYEVLLFDPTSLLTGAEPESLKAMLTIEGVEDISIPLGTFKTYRVKMNYVGSEVTAWITRDGGVIKEVSPLGIVSFKEKGGESIENRISSLDIVGKTAISSNLRVENPRGLEFLRIRIGGIESLEGLDLRDDYRQFIKDGLLEIRVGSLSDINTYEIPYTGREFKEYTQESILIQSKNDEIVKKAGVIVGNERNSLEAVKKINDWVHKNLEKTPTISLPNALDVLATGKGDCNEHATLFTALARAAGIPTKLVLGLVFLDGKFYYHAWNEVFAGKWIAVDPTFGQFPADASHIKFVEGNLNRGTEILRLVGKIELDVVEAS